MTTGQSTVIAAHSGDRPLPGTSSLGPIPLGRYEILASRTNRYGNTYRLESQDGTRNDFDKGTGRSRFRMHRGTFTTGCINVTDDESWSDVDSLIQSTSTSTVPDYFKGDRMFGLGDSQGSPTMLYGYLAVIE